MSELWQLYDKQGLPLPGSGATKDDVFSKGLLHGASHVWIWRMRNGVAEVLLQKRALDKLTWPDCYDISAAGHIDIGEDPLTAALRETKEEIGLDIASDTLHFFGVHRAYLAAEHGAIENEFQWLYNFRLDDNTDFNLQTAEVASLTWMSVGQLENDCSTSQYVPHGRLYYETVIAALKTATRL